MNRQIMINHRTVNLRPALLEEIIDLRHRILRAGLPRDTAIFPGDELQSSFHLAAFDERAILACGTFHLNQYEGQPAYQLRGMTVDKPIQGTGLGRALLEYSEDLLRARGGIRQLWCNAHAGAAPFYMKQGWQTVSEEFDIETAGPHVRMAKLLS